jgi:hypothetical protein
MPNFNEDFYLPFYLPLCSRLCLVSTNTYLAPLRTSSVREKKDLVEILDPQQANTGRKTTCLSYLLVFFGGFSKLSQKYKICDKKFTFGHRWILRLVQLF